MHNLLNMHKSQLSSHINFRVSKMKVRGLTMLMRTQMSIANVRNPLCNKLKPQNASKLDQDSSFMMTIEKQDFNAS